MPKIIVQVTDWMKEKNPEALKDRIAGDYITVEYDTESPRHGDEEGTTLHPSDPVVAQEPSEEVASTQDTDLVGGQPPKGPKVTD